MKRPGFFRRALEAVLPGLRQDVSNAVADAQADRHHRALDCLDEIVQQPSRHLRPGQPPVETVVARIPRSAAIKAAKKTGFALMSREAHAAASRKGAIASNKKRWAK